MAVPLMQMAICGRKCAIHGTESMWEELVNFIVQVCMKKNIKSAKARALLGKFAMWSSLWQCVDLASLCVLLSFVQAFMDVESARLSCRCDGLSQLCVLIF